MGMLMGLWAAAMLSALWVVSPIFAVSLGILLAIAPRFLGCTKAYRAGLLLGALLTIADEWWLFSAAGRGQG
jgi:hypothetical protein